MLWGLGAGFGLEFGFGWSQGERLTIHDLDANELTVLAHYPCRMRKLGSNALVLTGVVSVSESARGGDHGISAKIRRIRNSRFEGRRHVGSSTIRATHGGRPSQAVLKASDIVFRSAVEVSLWRCAYMARGPEHMFRARRDLSARK